VLRHHLPADGMGAGTGFRHQGVERDPGMLIHADGDRVHALSLGTLPQRDAPPNIRARLRRPQLAASTAARKGASPRTRLYRPPVAPTCPSWSTLRSRNA